MTALITILISLLGYGSPEDFSHMSESELNTEIATLEASQDDGGTNNDWEQGVDSTPEPINP
jgi:hypothetical protein